MTKQSAIIGFILCFFGGIALMWGIERGAEGGLETADITAEEYPSGPWSDSAAAVPVTDKDPNWGSRGAPATLVLFSDFQCPHCASAEHTVEKLKKKYGPGKLRVVWKHFAVHASAKNTHIAAEEVFQLAGSEAFWKFTSIAMENPRQQTPENLTKWAVQAGVDQDKFAAAFAKKGGKAKVDEDMKVGRAAGVGGTPAFFINGVALTGNRSIAEFSSEIDKQLAAGKKLRGKGTKPEELYVALTNANKSPGSAGAGEAREGAKDKPKRQPQKIDKTVWKAAVLDSDPVKGPNTALVTVVEFSEFQCPFCSKVLPTLKKIRDTYGDKVRIVWKGNPLDFHKRAEPAEQFVREAHAQKGDDGFWKAHDLLFQNQKKLSDEDLAGHAAQLGLDVGKVKEAIGSHKYAKLITAVQDLAFDLNARGTPHFFVNGRRVKGALPFEEFKSLIDEELKKAEAMVGKGIKPEAVYAEIMKNAKGVEIKDPGKPHDNSPWKGASEPKIVIHEFSEFQCPYCSKVNPTLDKLVENYGDTVRIYFRHRPLNFHKQAGLAAEAAQEAYAQKGNEGFWAFHDLMFKNQRQLERQHLEQYAQQLGLDMDQFRKALDDRTHKSHIDYDAKAANNAQIGGTPGFVVNGRFINGALPYEAFEKVIKRVLKDMK